MRIIFPNLSYCEALNKAGIPTLSERRESLSIKLFEDIVSNEHHKLANLLPQMSSSYARRLRNKRRFNTPVCRTDRFMNSFLSYFFVKKIPLSRRVEYVMDGSMDESESQ